MKIQPDTHVLEALRSQSLGWTRALGELIDNSIDARAANVTIISEGRGAIEIKDDGEGVPDMTSVFQLGHHRPHAGAAGLGRFGIGLKDAALWLWGTTIVESVRGARRYTARVNWERLCKSRVWEIDDPDEGPSHHEATGTRIVFLRPERLFPSGKDLDRLIAELGFIFSPAIKRGVRIVIRCSKTEPRELQRCEAPELEHEVDGQIDVDGRAAHVHVGVVREGAPNPHSGIHYIHRHRVIIPRSGLGCGDVSTARIFGWVTLSDQWGLTKNKDEITERKDELGDAVHAFIKPVLDIAATQAESLSLQGLEADLTKLLRVATSRTERERREKAAKHGTVVAQETKRKRNAVKRQPGNRLPGQLDAGLLRVEFDESLDPETEIGNVDSHGNRVRLAIRHPWVASLRQADDRSSLFQLALGLLVHHCVMDDDSGQRFLPGMYDIAKEQQFSAMLSSFMMQIAAPRPPRIQVVA